MFGTYLDLFSSRHARELVDGDVLEVLSFRSRRAMTSLLSTG